MASKDDTSTLNNVDPKKQRKRLTGKQRTYLAGVLSGESKTAAAIAAGYSAATAHNAATNIENKPVVRRFIEDILTSAGVDEAYMSKRIREGLDATSGGGRKRTVNFTERRLMLECVLRIKGYFAPMKFEVRDRTLEEILGEANRGTWEEQRSETMNEKSELNPSTDLIIRLDQVHKAMGGLAKGA